MPEVGQRVQGARAYQWAPMIVSPYMGAFPRKQSGTWRLEWAGAVSVTLAGGMALGQATTTLMVPQGPLLPASFANWELEGVAPSCTDCYRGEQDQEAVLHEDGLRRGSHMLYHQPGSGQTLDVRALQFEDATGAVSAYTYLRTPEMKIVPQGSRVGREESAAPGRYLFREGATTVLAEVSSPGSSTAADLRTLAGMLPKIGGPKGAPPLLPTLLPASHLIPERVRYAVGPTGYAAMGGALPPGLVGFDKSAEAVTAEYAEGGGAKGLLTLLLLPTPEIAGDRGRAIEAALNAAGERAGTAKLRREGPLVILANRGFTQAEAAELVAGIHLRSEVTWNKQMAPEFHAEVRKTASLLVSIAVFSGVAGMAAVLLGLFLGFGRAWVRVLMGKPAATEPEFLRLDLRDSRGEARAGGKSAGV